MFILLGTSTGIFAIENKCSIKLRLKVELEGNDKYYQCLGNFSDYGKDQFEVNRTYRYTDLTEKECTEIAPEQLLGQTFPAKFYDHSSMAYGFEPIEFSCEATAIEILRVKFKPAK